MKKILLILILGLSTCSFTMESSNLKAQYEKEIKLIENEMEGIMIKGDYTSSSMNEAGSYRYKEADKLLNKYYQLLIKNLSKDQQNQLIKSQKKWIEYRDEEFELYSNIYFDMYNFGTMGPQLYYGYIYGFVDTRIHEIISLIESFNME